jgi:hypothetical protein
MNNVQKVQYVQWVQKVEQFTFDEVNGNEKRVF